LPNSGVTAFQVVVLFVLRKLSRFELTSSDGFSVFFFSWVTQIRPSLRSDSDINVSFDWFFAVYGIQVDESEHKRVGEVGTFLVNLMAADPLEPMALVDRKKVLP
jgi:hypothetical protein